MVKMNAKRIREMNLEEKQKKLQEYKTELSFQRALLASGNRTESPSKIKSLRKSIARLKTFITMDQKKQNNQTP
nr:50S ribosomal protein L29 [Candidatus Sigynarchaeota archaeon]